MQKRVLTFAVALVLCVGLAVTSFAVDEEGDFRISGTVLTSYHGPGGDVTIPYGVTEIGEGAFYHCDELTGVTIPDSVTTIGKGAFCVCQGLTSVTIPDSVTYIGDKAFAGTGLTDVTIPKGTEVGKKAFFTSQKEKTVRLVIMIAIVTAVVGVVVAVLLVVLKKKAMLNKRER